MESANIKMVKVLCNILREEKVPASKVTYHRGCNWDLSSSGLKSRCTHISGSDDPIPTIWNRVPLSTISRE